MLPWAAGGLALGVVLAGKIPGILLALVGLLFLRKVQLAPWQAGLLTALLIMSPAAWWAEFRKVEESPHAISRLAPKRFLRVEATVLSPPVAQPDGWRARVLVTRVVGDFRVHSEQVMMATWPASERPIVGDRWRLVGRLSRPDGAANPGEFDYREFLARQGIFATFRAEEASWVGVDAAQTGPRLIDKLRLRLLGGLQSGLQADQAALLGSLVLGGGAAPVSDATEAAFRRAGLSHLLAASGAQVALLAGLLYGALRLLRVAPPVAALATAPWLLVYLALTGAPPSMVRATLMGLVGLGAIALGKREVPFAALWIAAIAMLLWEPQSLFDLGFQFSFLATYGLMRLGYGLQEIEVPGPRWLVALLLVPVVAWTWVTPWQAGCFQTWVPFSLVANWAASPLILAMTPWGLAIATVGMVSPETAALLNGLSAHALDGLTWMVQFFADMPGAERTAPFLSPWALLFIYLGLWAGFRHPRVAIGSWIIALCLIPLRQPAELRLTILSVGQGDAIVAQTPGGRWIVVDGGPAGHGADQGARVVLPYLRREGCRAIDLMVATHAHRDHVGGLTALSAALPVRSAWDAGQSEPSATHQQLLATWLSRGVPWRVPRPGHYWQADGVRVEVLGPVGVGETVNDGSLVVKLTHGSFSALLAGDMEAEGEAALSRRYPSLKADVLKVGHHGSRGASTTPWLRRVRPKLAIVSVGARNVFGHPHPDTLQRLRDAGTRVVRTDRHGAVVIQSTGRRWSYTTRVTDWR